MDAKVARLSRGLAASAVLCAVALRAEQARAQDPQATLLVYRAPPDCPAVGDFQSSVQRRSARIHFVDEGSHERQLSIYLRKDGDYTVGELRLIEKNGTLRQRSVRFTTCAEAVDGLALIATVSLDPQAMLQTPEPVPETLPQPPPKVPQHQRTPPPPREQPPRGASRVETKVGAELKVDFRALPKAAFGGSVFLEVGSASRHWLSPLIRGAISHVERLGVPEATSEVTGEANFALTLTTLSLCPLRIGSNGFTFRPCASGAAGALRSWSSKTADPQPRTRPYMSWGPSGILAIQLGELVEIVGDAGLGVTVIRDSFRFGNCTGSVSGPDCTQVLKTPALYISSGLGFSLLLP